MVLRITQYAKAPRQARERDAANRLAIMLRLIEPLPNAESRKAVAARLRGLYAAMVAIGPGKY